MSGPSTQPPDRSQAPLAGLKVLEIAVMFAGPFAGRLLHDLGASVIKVEDPAAGDPSRHWIPAKNGLGLSFARVNTSKRSVAIDLRKQEGQALIKDLVRQSDVVIENFRPGRMELWSLGYEDLKAVNPSVIMVRISGYGQTGPYRDRPGFGTVADAFSGFAYINGWPETPPTIGPFGLTDQIAGLAAAYATLAATVRRERTGRGEEVDVALYEPLLGILGDITARYSALGVVAERSGSDTKSAAPRGLYKAKDGWLALSGSSQNTAERVFEAMGRTDLLADPRFATNPARVAHVQELNAIINEWIGSHTRQEILRLLDEHDVPAGRVNDARDLVEDPALRERGSLVEMNSRRLGTVVIPGPIARFRSYPAPTYGGPPELGEHTREVLQGMLGLSDAEVDRLASSGVIHEGAPALVAS